MATKTIEQHCTESNYQHCRNIYYHVRSLCDLLDADLAASDQAKGLAAEICSEIEIMYLEASDRYNDMLSCTGRKEVM